MEAITDTWIKMAVRFRNVLHGLRASIGTGLGIMDLNMVQDLVSINQYPI